MTTKNGQQSNKPVKQEETKAIVTYGDWTPEQMEKEAAEMGGGGDFWKVPVGTTVIRVLPPKVGWPSPFVLQHQHFFNMPGVEHDIIFCCPKMHKNEKCLVCLKADAMESSGNARDEKAAKRLRPSKRMLANIVVNPKVPESKVVIWGFGKTVYEQLKSIRENEEGGGNFLDPYKGFNLAIKRVGTGKEDTKYTIMAARNSSELVNMDWIEMQTDNRRLIRLPTIEQQKRLIAGEDPRDVWGDERPDKAHGGTRRRDDASGDSEFGDAIDAEFSEQKGGRTASDDLFDDEVDLD